MTTATALDPLSLFRLDGKVAVVTGASSGLGERFARVLDAVGARVVDRRPAGRSARGAGRRPHGRRRRAGRPGPPGGPRAPRARRSLDTCGRIDVLVNNAGIGGKVSLEDEPLDDFRSVMEVNVTAIWHLCKLFRAALVADGGGSIVNVASMLGHVGSTPVKQASYCASKGAVVNMTRELALQFARKQRPGQRAVPGLVPVRADRRHGDRRRRHRLHRGQRPDAADGRRRTSSTAPCCC